MSIKWFPKRVLRSCAVTTGQLCQDIAQSSTVAPKGISRVNRCLPVLLFCLLSACVYAQNTHCLGLKNPTSFEMTGGAANSSWTGYLGNKDSVVSTCSSIPFLLESNTQTIPAPQLESITFTGSNDRCENRSRKSKDIMGNYDNKRRFVIKGAGLDTMTAMHLSYLPPDSSFTSSIRLGNYCGGHEAEALAYQFDVSPNNALISIWYAMSLQDAGHATFEENPEFVIQVEKREYNQWVRIGGDTLCYVQPTPRTQDSIGVFKKGVPKIGWEPAARNPKAGNLYKEWQKVTIDLSQYLYATVRIIVASSDCYHTSHYGCCYIAGECQPMKMQVDACAHTSAGVSVLRAPDGLLSYQWYRSKTGVLSAAAQRMDSSYVILLGDTSSTLNVNIGHFVNYYTNDTMQQTQFKCVMQSLMNHNNPSARVVSTLLAEISDDGSIPVYQTVCDSLRWVDTVITASGVYSKTFSSVHGCDSIVNLHLTVNRSTKDDTAVNACDSYSWRGMNYTTSGIYTYRDTNAFGCNYNDTLRLAVNQSTAEGVADTVCNLKVWYDSTYTVSGAYSHHLTNVSGCDSVLTLHLTVNYGAMGDTSATSCDQYVWNDSTYRRSGDFMQMFPALNGCDSVATLHLTIHTTYDHLFPHTYCDTFTWEGHTYHAPHDTAVHHYTAVNGCDSAVTYHLTRHLSVTATDRQTACDSFLWHGAIFTESTDTAVYHDTTVNGCDSAVTLRLTINRSTESRDELESCDSLLWWRDSVMYRHGTTSAYVTYTNTAGCDSTVWLWLKLYTGDSSESSRTVCDSMRWIDGRYYSADTTVSALLASVHGCDSVVTLHLTVNRSSIATVSDSAYGSYTWRDGNTYWHDTVVSYILTNAAGCDSMLSYHIIVKPVPIEIVNLDDHVIVVNHYPLGRDSLRFDFLDYRWYRDSTYLGEYRHQDYITSIPQLCGLYHVEVPTDPTMQHWQRSNTVHVYRLYNEPALSAWPSPLSSGAQLHIAATDDVTSCWLYDNQGRLCMTIPISQGSATIPIRLSSGVYTLTDGRGNQVRIVVY